MSDAADPLLHILQYTVRSELGRNEADLTLRQLGVFLVVYQAEEPQTVRGLAKTLSIGKPIVTRVLDRISMAGLVRRIRDPADGRSVLVMRTEQGKAMMHRLSQAMASASSTLAPSSASGLAETD